MNKGDDLCQIPNDSNACPDLFYLGGVPIWENPELFALNRLPARANFFSFDSPAQARSMSREESSRYVSLNGKWIFTYYERASEVPSFAISQIPANRDEVEVPGNWTLQGYGCPHYTNVQMPFSSDYPHVPLDNPVGVYTRWIEAPSHWKDKRIVVQFGGAESLLIVYLDGKPVGLSKDSRLPAEFDLTAFITPGKKHLLTAAVIKWSDATFIEDQDQWWMGGLHREVFLFATSKTWIRDVFVRGDFDNNTGEGVLTIQAKVGSSKDVVSVCELSFQLYGPDNKAIWERPCSTVIDRNDIGGRWQNSCELTEHVKDARPWSDESPTLYRLVVSLKSGKKNLEATAVMVGFRKVQISGGELLLNGKAIIFNGVNRHEHDPVRGKAITRDSMERDVRMMKQNNFNAVRNAHYPTDRYFYELCDQHGLLVIDEANIEAHAFCHNLCWEPRYAAAFLERVKNMVEHGKNHPSIVTWSLGNESGYGANHDAAAGYVRRLDPSRPLHYEGAVSLGQHEIDWNHGYAATDIVCPMYSHPDDLLSWAHAYIRDERPIYLCEYSHSMGNSNGGLEEYFKIFRAQKGFQGGFIWEWCDQTLWKEAADGERYLAYGGDYGDTPNDANFVCDGIVSAERDPHPALWEYRYLAQPVGVELYEVCSDGSAIIKIHNRRKFTSLEDIIATWRLLKDGLCVANGELKLQALEADKTTLIKVELDAFLDCENEWFLDIDFRSALDQLWLPKGHLIGWEQLVLRERKATKTSPVKSGGAPLLNENERKLSIEAGALRICLNQKSGCLESMQYDSTEVLQSAPRLNLWRAPTDNDGIKLWTGQEGKPLGRWIEAGYDRLQHSLESCEISQDAKQSTYIKLCALLIGAKGRPAFRVETAYRIHRGGILEANYLLTCLEREMPDLPRVGIELGLASEFAGYSYYGRGPWECYPDRQAAARLGIYKGAVCDNKLPYVMPQEYGLRTDLRWLKLHASKGLIMRVTSDQFFAFSARPYSDAALYEATHAHELKESESTWLYLDHRHRGLGTLSCGPDTFERYKLTQSSYSFQFCFDFLINPEEGNNDG